MRHSVNATIRPVEEADRQTLWEWANDPEVRRQSFNQDYIPWENHVEWFAGKYNDSHCVWYIVLDEAGAPAGVVRFDRAANEMVEVHITVAPEKRGQGVGAEALRLACARVQEETTYTEVLANIMVKNVASQRAFENAGFEPVTRLSIDGFDMIVMTKVLVAASGHHREAA